VDFSRSVMRSYSVNEKFAIDPSTCTSWTEWRFLLQLFGPMTGRYVIDGFPSNWNERVLQNVANVGPVEEEKIKTVIRRAKEGRALYRQAVTYDYSDGDDWFTNLIKQKSLISQLAGVVLQEKKAGVLPCYDFESLDLPPTADEQIRSKPEEFARVAETIVAISPKIYIVDPYFDVCKFSHRKTIELLLQAAKGKTCLGLEIWARAGLQTGNDVECINHFRKLRKDLKLDRCKIKIHLSNDEKSVDKMHDRYVFGQYGGVRFSHGVQQHSGSTDVQVMGKALLDVYWTKFSQYQTTYTYRTIDI